MSYHLISRRALLTFAASIGISAVARSARADEILDPTTPFEASESESKLEGRSFEPHPMDPRSSTPAPAPAPAHAAAPPAPPHVPAPPPPPARVTSRIVRTTTDARGVTLVLELEHAPFPAPGSWHRDPTVIVFV